MNSKKAIAKFSDLLMKDIFSVMCEILENDWQSLRNKDTRLENFGKMFTDRFIIQVATHDTKNYDLLKKAGLAK